MNADARGGAQIPHDTSRKANPFFLSPPKTEALRRGVIPHSRAARDLVAYTVSSSCWPVPADNAEGAVLCLCVLLVGIPSVSTSQPPRHQHTKRPSLLHPRLRPYRGVWLHSNFGGLMRLWLCRTDVPTSVERSGGFPAGFPDYRVRGFLEPVDLSLGRSIGKRGLGRQIRTLAPLQDEAAFIRLAAECAPGLGPSCTSASRPQCRSYTRRRTDTPGAF